MARCHTQYIGSGAAVGFDLTNKKKEVKTDRLYLTWMHVETVLLWEAELSCGPAGEMPGSDFPPSLCLSPQGPH